MGPLLSKYSRSTRILKADIVRDNEDKKGCTLNDYGYHSENESDVSAMGNLV